MSKRTATQLTVTIPEGAPAGSILSIPVNGKDQTIKARVPEGLGPGSTLVLTQYEGSDEWTEEVVDSNKVHAQAQPMPVIPGAVVGLDLNMDGLPDLIVAGPDLDQDGIPDALQQSGGPFVPVQMTSQEPPPQEDPSLVPSGPVAYTVRLDTSAGVIDIIVRPDWAPHGARRFLELAACGDLDGLTFYRAVKGCLAQFGLPAKRQWQPLPDDPPTAVPFLLGAVCFAAVGKNSRKSTLFVCIGDMSHCFGQSPWETPIGAVAEASLDVLDRIETIYGDIAECGGAGPNTSRINAEGDEYLQANFPLLTRIHSAKPLDWPPTNEPLTNSVPTQAPTSPAEHIASAASSAVPANAEPMVDSDGKRGQEPGAAASSGSRSGSVAGPISNGSGPSRMPSSAKQKAAALEPVGGHTGPAHGGGTPIDVPVEVVPASARGKREPMSRVGRKSTGGVLDVPVEVCSARRRQTFGGVTSSGAQTARSSSRGGVVRIVKAAPSACDSPVLLTPSQASSVSMVSGGGLQPLGMLNRSVNLSFEQQAQAQVQALQQAHAQAHGQSLQMQALGSVQMLPMQPQNGQPFAQPPLASLGNFPGNSMLMEPQPLGTCGSVYGQGLDTSFNLGGGMLGPQSPQQPPLASPGAFGGHQLQPPMSPLGFMTGPCPSPCGGPGGLAPSMPLGSWPQR